MGTTGDFIEMIEHQDEAGSPVWVPATEATSTDSAPLTVTDGDVRAGDRPVSSIPQERFAADTSATDLARMIQQIRDAEAGRASTEIAVRPDGKIVPARPGQHDAVASTVPRERFAGPPAGDTLEIRRIDPRQECDWRWHDDVKGWSFRLRPDVFGPSEYRFLVRREPHRNNEWFAYCLAPNLDHLVGHRHHLQRLGDSTVVCLRPGFRGHPNLGEAHGALAKWCIYIEFIQRGLPAPFSE